MLLFAVVALLAVQSCKKDSKPEQGELVASANMVSIYHQSVVFSIFLTTMPEINDTWRITNLPFFLIADQMTGTISKSVAELKFRFNPEVSHLENYFNYSIEILSERSGTLSITVHYHPSDVIDINVTPASLHFNESDTVKSMTFRNNTAETTQIAIYPQYDWIKFVGNNSSNNVYYMSISRDSEESVSLKLNLENDDLMLGHNTNMLMLRVDRSNSTGDIAELFMYEITADIPPTKELKAIQSSLSFNYHDSIAWLTLRNSGNTSLSWAASCDDDFVSFEPAQGTINGKDMVNVQIQIDRNNFDQYAYETILKFNWDEGVVEIPVTIFHDPKHWKPFPSVKAIDYSKAADKIIVITNTDEFILYEPDTDNHIKIPSLQGSTAFAINKEGTFAVVSKENQIVRLNLLTLATDHEQTIPAQLRSYKLYGNDILYYYANNSGTNFLHHYLNLSTSETIPYKLKPLASNLEKNPDQQILYVYPSNYLYTYDIATSPGLLIGTTNIVTYNYYDNKNWIDYNNNMIFNGGQIFNINTPPDFLPELITHIQSNYNIKHVHSSEELQRIFLVYIDIKAYNPDQNYDFVKEYVLPPYVSFAYDDYTLKNLSGLFCFTRNNHPGLYVVAKENSVGYKLTTLMID